VNWQDWLIWCLSACGCAFVIFAAYERDKGIREDLIGGRELDQIGECLGLKRRFLERDARFRKRCVQALYECDTGRR
jgi:hypothetical protein